MSVRPPRTIVQRGSRTLVLAAVAVLPTVGFVAASDSADAVLLNLKSSPSTRTPMVNDRAAVADLRREAGVEQRQMVLGWYAAAAKVDDARRRDDHTRASRGEPRPALGGPVDRNQYWRPTVGPLTQPFHPGHDGIDIGVPVGTPVVAATDGVVTFAGEESGYGTHVEVRHADGTVTTYSHLSAIGVAVDERVGTGQEIARSGNTGHSTGPHLHFEVHPPDKAKPGTTDGGDTKTGSLRIDPIAWLEEHGAW